MSDVVRPAFWALGHNSRCSLMKPLIRPLVKNLSDQLGSYLAGCLLISSNARNAKICRLVYTPAASSQNSDTRTLLQIDVEKFLL